MNLKLPALTLGLIVSFFVLFNSSAHATPCPRGSFSLTGQEPCQEAATGTYVDQEGQLQSLLTPPGYVAADTGQILPSPVQGGRFTPFAGESIGFECRPGTASRAGAVQCGSVGQGVPQALGPEFNSNFGTGGTIDLGRLDVSQPSNIAASRSIVIEIANDAEDFGLDGALSSDLTLMSFAFRGGNSDLFSLSGFTPNMVIGEGEAISLTINIASFDLSIVGTQPIYDSELTFRTDQGNAFGFDPANFGFDAVAVEQSYEAFRISGPSGPSALVLPLSQEFTFTVFASVPEPGAFALFGIGLFGLCAVRRRRTL